MMPSPIKYNNRIFPLKLCTQTGEDSEQARAQLSAVLLLRNEL